MLEEKIVRNRYFWLLFVFNFLSFSSITAINTLPEYFYEMGLSKSFAGFFMNIHVLGLIVFVIFLLPLVESIGKKRIIVISYLLELLAYILMFIFAWNMILLVIFRIISSFSYAVAFSVNADLVFDALPTDKRREGIAIFGISGVMSGPFCAWVGGYLVKIDPRYLFVFGAILTVMSLMFVFKLREKPVEKETHHVKNVFDVVKRKYFWNEFLAGMVLGGAFATLSSFIPQHTIESFGTSLLAEYFTAYLVVTILFRLFLSSKMNTIDYWFIVFVGLFTISISMFNLAIALVNIQVIITGILYGFAHSLLYPSLSSMVVSKSQEAEKYITNSVFIGFYSLGSLVFPYLLGVIGDLFFTSSIFIVFGIVSFVVSGVFLVKRKQTEYVLKD